MKKKKASISAATYIQHAFAHSPTPCFIICLIGIRVVLGNGSVAKATTAGGTEWRGKDSEGRGKGEGEQ